ncbi:hypothetical protein QWL27_21365 [Streptomyces thermocarboxydus]|uniref:tetratricopeptide repeat protein n=1 Tax=Streptomyces thermocarboxydus TaxID=59299 RepID=UPI0025C9EE1E|nr:hypothetical protein [Streptomyces thermocarboxydus]
MSPRTNDSTRGSGRETRPPAEAAAGTEAAAAAEAPSGAEAAQAAEAPSGTEATQPADAPSGTEAAQAADAPSGTEAAQAADAPSGTEAAQAAEAAAGTEAAAAAEAPSGTEATQPADAPSDVAATQPADAPSDVAATQPADAPSGAEATRPAEARATAKVPAASRVPATSKVPTASEAPAASKAPAAAAAPRTASSADRVDALRRFAAAVRRGRGLHVASCAVLLAVAMTAGAVAVGGDGQDAARALPGVSRAVNADVLVRGDLDTAIRSLHEHVRLQPRDFAAWATLGLAQVERARTDGDPSRYDQAERALARSLALRPGNDQALAGQAALAAARHDFAAALAHADRALEANPYSERALCSRIDALVELGRYAEAVRAATVADRRHPGVPVFTRYAYVHELRGDVRTARRVLHQALVSATGPADVAYVATALGNLERGQGRYGTALRHYARALAADDAYLPSLEGRARAQAADGDRAGAITTLEQVVDRSPLPGPLVALGELYEERDAPGDRANAREQYALVSAWTALARAGGVDVDLDTALAAADHGDTAEALRAARAEWERRRTVHTADALAWALHRAGRSAEALPYARRATATGYRDATFLYHRGVIEKAAGHDRAARASLTAALELNPGFSPLGARAARAALKDLEAAR